MKRKGMTSAALFLVAGALGLARCGESPREAPPPKPAAPVEPWAIEDALPDISDGIRVLVLHDMEGLSGQDDWHTFEFGTEAYKKGQELLAGDVNAVVDGLLAGGATEVEVVDGHGSGNPDPDVRPDLLDPRARQVFRDKEFDSYMDLVEPGAYDAVALVGMHAKTGSRGFASHTYTLGIELIVNGWPISETEWVGLSWGRAGVPVIFASGDDRLAENLKTMPWIEYVTVKKATSASTAELRPLEDARADLREGARRAVADLVSAKVMKVTAPIRAAVHAVPPASLQILEGFPGVDYKEDTVTFEASDLTTAYKGFEKIIRVAGTAYRRVLTEQLRQRADWKDLSADLNEALMIRWLDYESGRWQPDELKAPEHEAKSKYHGFQE